MHKDGFAILYFEKNGNSIDYAKIFFNDQNNIILFEIKTKPISFQVYYEMFIKQAKTVIYCIEVKTYRIKK